MSSFPLTPHPLLRSLISRTSRRSFRAAALLGIVALLAASSGYMGRPSQGRPEPAGPQLLDWRTPLSAGTLVEAADEIFSGEVVDREATTGANQMITTRVFIQVHNRIKGPNDALTAVRMIGGEDGGKGLWRSDQPEFYMGEEVFVFARRNADSGELEVLPLPDGKLHVQSGQVAGARRSQSMQSLVAELRDASDREGRGLPTRVVDTTHSSGSPAAPNFVEDQYLWQNGAFNWYYSDAASQSVAGLPSYPQLQATANSAFLGWAGFANVNPHFVDHTDHIPDVLCRNLNNCPAPTPSNGNPNGLNVVGWLHGLVASQTQQGILLQPGLTQCEFLGSVPHYNTHCDIGLNVDMLTNLNPPINWSVGAPPPTTPDYTLDLLSVLAHEVGHFLGLRHSWQPGGNGYPGSPTQSDIDAIMYYVIQVTAEKRYLASDDQAGILRHYGARPTPGPPRINIPITRN